MKILCHTNIDCAKNLKWPTHLPARPMIGDLIRSESSTAHKHIELQVCELTWIRETEWNSYDKQFMPGEWCLLVELHLPRGRFEHIGEFVRFLERKNP